MNLLIPTRPFTLAATAAAALLAACGGGGYDADTGLSTEVAQGYAADAASMPVQAATGVDASVVALEAALAASGTSASREQPQVSALLETTLPGGTVACANGGTLTWGVSGGTSQTQLNGQLDAGESYVVTYAACGTGSGVVLDGAVTLAVTARSSSASDLTLTATALQQTTAMGQFVLDGSQRWQRSVVATSGGGTQVTGQLSSSGSITLASTISARRASYTLNSLDWTVVKTFDANGALVSRTHQGNLSLAASTPRRPNATLQISTQGALTLASDGLAAQGGFVVVTRYDKITGNYGSGTVTLMLDIGNDGSIDRTWTLTRPTFNGEAG